MALVAERADRARRLELDSLLLDRMVESGLQRWRAWWIHCRSIAAELRLAAGGSALGFTVLDNGRIPAGGDEIRAGFMLLDNG